MNPPSTREIKQLLVASGMARKNRVIILYIES
jgi:hypothetical protein